MKTNFLSFFFLAFTVIVFLLFIYQNRWAFQQKFDPLAYENFYQHSQYSDYKNLLTMPDEDLYAFAGWHYLTTGELGKVNIEHPPLGKYFIGFSILLFNNQNILQIFWGMIFLILIYLLGEQLTKKPLILSAVVLLVVLEPLFRHQLIDSLLDLPLAVFTLLYLLSIKKIPDSNFWLGIAGISLGAAAAAKFPALALILILASLLSLLFQKRKNRSILLKKLLIVNLIAFSIFTLTYLPFILSQSFLDWINLLIKGTRIHLSHAPNYPKGVILKALFLNQWPRWWEEGEFQKILEWQLTWPLLGLSFLLSPLLALKNKLFKQNAILFLFCWLYFLFLASRLFFPAYLLPLLPLGFLLFLLLSQLLLRNKSNLFDQAANVMLNIFHHYMNPKNKIKEDNY